MSILFLSLVSDVSSLSLGLQVELFYFYLVRKLVLRFKLNSGQRKKVMIKWNVEVNMEVTK